jgi:hypothetical protein
VADVHLVYGVYGAQWLARWPRSQSVVTVSAGGPPLAVACRDVERQKAVARQ